MLPDNGESNATKGSGAQECLRRIKVIGTPIGGFELADNLPEVKRAMISLLRTVLREDYLRHNAECQSENMILLWVLQYAELPQRQSAAVRLESFYPSAVKKKTCSVSSCWGRRVWFDDRSATPRRFTLLSRLRKYYDYLEQHQAFFSRYRHRNDAKRSYESPNARQPAERVGSR